MAGNVRELRNAIERAMLLVDRSYLEPQDFTLTRSVSPVEFTLPLKASGSTTSNVSSSRRRSSVRAAIKPRRRSCSVSTVTRFRTA